MPSWSSPVPAAATRRRSFVAPPASSSRPASAAAAPGSSAIAAVATSSPSPTSRSPDEPAGPSVPLLCAARGLAARALSHLLEVRDARARARLRRRRVRPVRRADRAVLLAARPRARHGDRIDRRGVGRAPPTRVPRRRGRGLRLVGARPPLLGIERAQGGVPFRWVGPVYDALSVPLAPVAA